MTKKKALVWFRRDLRLSDNPALAAAVEADADILPVFVLDDAKTLAPGGASKWWLHHSLASLSNDLSQCGVNIVLKRGDESSIIQELVGDYGITHVFWNRRYDKQGIETDKSLKSWLNNQDIEAKSFNGSLLREPWEVETNGGDNYKVFTPFWKSLRSMGPARGKRCERPSALSRVSKKKSGDDLDDWDLLPTKPNWATDFDDFWQPGEAGAMDRLDDFIDDAANGYKEDRNRPDLEGTSRLSPHLAFGEIGPLQVWQKMQDALSGGKVRDEPGVTFLSEIAWREFSYSLLYYYPDLATKPYKEKFEDFPWEDNDDALRQWQKGMTGYPIVDAGMRQLWKKGWMHNRVRMIVGSFLVKNMLIPWQSGEKWFWDTLVDADPASNAASWQWVAGSGADASPYFRIFNPLTQSEKFDPNGDYIREFVPELANLPGKYIHAPFDAPKEVLSKAGVKLGESYPKPVLDLKPTRERALDAYQKIKNS